MFKCSRAPHASLTVGVAKSEISARGNFRYALCMSSHFVYSTLQLKQIADRNPYVSPIKQKHADTVNLHANFDLTTTFARIGRRPAERYLLYCRYAICDIHF